MSANKVRVTVIGGGIAGPVIALYLHKYDFEVTVFERVREPKDVGGSLNIWPNGLKSLSMIGLHEKIIQNGEVLKMHKILKPNGEVLVDTDYPLEVQNIAGFPVVGILRSAVSQILRDELKEKCIDIHFNKELVNIIEEENCVKAIFQDGTVVESDILVGGDGIHSKCRATLFGVEKPTYTGLTQTIGLSTYKSDLSYLFNVYGIGQFFISYAYSKDSYCWAATLPEPENPETWKSLSKEQAENFQRTSHFTTWCEPVSTLLKNSDRIIKVGLYDRPALKSWHKSRVVLIGDAAHPTSPHLGQGANQAMEDCFYLTRYLVRSNIQKLGHQNVSAKLLEEVFTNFENERIPKTSALVKEARITGELRVCEDPELPANYVFARISKSAKNET
eukprot:TRINITY_DN2742_c0_g1_i1.p1 TRINITY_DN2742_c0_g1~~TRINITY_DN2742_c0_g1_i1.p1  ORF type:complete len:390 (-),score=70.05 TRINITY_DN2742_c0_g1_i1:160-1329(-)